MEPINVFVGYDSREHIAFKVCEHSLVRRSSRPVRVFPLKHKDLRAAQYFNRPWRIDENGQGWDEGDGRPFSTDFAFTRFLTPFIAKANSLTGRVLFVDCDFLFLDDVSSLIDEASNYPGAVAVVKHEFVPRSHMKMDNKRQEGYPKKLWSSLIVWNLDHKSNEVLSLSDVNTREGRWLHNFSWLKEGEINPLSERWNWIPDVSPTLDKKMELRDIGALHFTEGGPWLENCRGVKHGDLWLLEQAHYIASMGRINKDKIRL